MVRNLLAVGCLFLLGLGLGGCTKCGWLWDEAPRSCHSGPPRWRAARDLFRVPIKIG